MKRYPVREKHLTVWENPIVSKPTHEEKTVPFVVCFGTQDLSHTKAQRYENGAWPAKTNPK